ncbi:MAG: PepSY-associated TM helix domain-containing protein [Daejeonella sp.]|uniref:PepSY-associated TM helix domain-containing protein n=1 Tax=Daejeonella sp. TaxID=2805397 RepID=UPI0027367D23|nr:PepSY-associated TM helix domain-containing protein [Daejeonella sp.]MDP3466920.1 PepSY-associated TM helix domain-containing protein [Daejeonella sp.]
MKQQKTEAAWPKLRKFLNDIHLWIGLPSGIIVLLICMTGTIYVFNTEIRELSSPELYKVKRVGDSQRISADKLSEIVSVETGGKVISIKIPADPERSYVLTVMKPEESTGNTGPSGNEKSTPPSPRIQYWVNPYSGKILGSSADKNAVSEFMQTMFSLHRWLLLDRIEEPLIGELPNKKLGSYISGTATILFTLGVITGIIIWFPQKIRNWKQGLKIKWNANWKRVNHDIHNSLGFYSCLFLFLMGITGPQWSFEWYRTGLRKTLGTYQSADAPKPETPQSDTTYNNGLKQVLLIDYIKSANKTLDYQGDLTISIPADSADAVLINKTKTGFFAPVAADKIYLDQYTSAPIKTEIFSEKPFNERVSNSIKALHVGDVYGKFSKIIYFLACLIATSLPVTGTLIWINKLKKRA